MMRIAAVIYKSTELLSKMSVIPKARNRTSFLSSTFINKFSTDIKTQPSSQYFKLPPIGTRKKQKFDYFLVIDFEATCDAPVNCLPQEIIEFPVLKINGTTFENESMFHSYVQPKVNPELSSFCTELTGIIQDMVDDEPPFEVVFENFEKWLKAEGLLDPGVKFVCVTCGDWDLKYMFQIQCKCSKVKIPLYMKSWINIKLCFAEMAETYPRNLATMLKYCGLQHQGRLHSGIDDCQNIAQILKNLSDRGIIYEINGSTH